MIVGRLGSNKISDREEAIMGGAEKAQPGDSTESEATDDAGGATTATLYQALCKSRR